MLSKNEKALMIYLQSNQKQYASTPSQEFNYLWQGANLTKEEAKIALAKLVKKELITEEPSNRETEEQRKLYGNIYRLTPKGSLFEFTSKREIFMGVGIGITTVLTTILAIIEFMYS